LRALAVISVVAYHLNPTWLPGGFIGVDIFFVISGYVVASSLARADTSQLGPFVLSFYARRLVRLYPALVVCLVTTFLAAVLFIPASWLSTTSWSTGLLAFAGLSNIALVWLNDGYFSPRAEFNPFTHTWSLGVEEQFYMLFPFLAFFWLTARTRTRTHQTDFVFGVAAVASTTFCAWASVARPDMAFYALPSRFWELASGVCLFVLHRRGLALPRTSRSAGAALAVGAGMLICGLCVSQRFAFPIPWGLLPAMGSLLCITAAVASSGQPIITGRLLELPAALYVGRLSYSIYLWHWPVIVLLRWTAGLDDLTSRMTAIAISIVLAIGSYHVIEQPSRQRLGSALSKPSRVLGLGWGSVALVVLACVGLVASRPWLSQTRAMRAQGIGIPMRVRWIAIHPRRSSTPPDNSLSSAIRMPEPIHLCSTGCIKRPASLSGTIGARAVQLSRPPPIYAGSSFAGQWIMY